VRFSLIAAAQAQPLLLCMPQRGLLPPHPSYLLLLKLGPCRYPCVCAGAPQKGLTASKERERGRRVEGDKFGPLKEWRVVYGKAGPQVRAQWQGVCIYGACSLPSSRVPTTVCMCP